MNGDNEIGPIKQGVQSYNRQPYGLFIDWTTKQVFDSMNEKPDCMVGVAVSTLNDLWGTQLFPEEKMEMSKTLARRWRLFRRLELMDNCKIDKDEIKKPFDLLVGCCQGLQHPRRNYSFTSKFLHWQSRGMLPIVDSHARSAICQIPDSGISGERVIEEHFGDYLRWLQFYSRIAGKLNEDQRAELVEHDLRTQEKCSARYAMENTLVRILDKHYYIKGREDG